MKYRSLQCNSAQELESQECVVTCSVDSMNMCLWPTLSILQKSRVGWSANRPVRIVLCLSSGSDHTSVSTTSAAVATAARILPSNSGRVWATAQVESVSCVPPDEIKWCEVRRTRWLSNGVASPHQFMWNRSKQQAPICNVNMRRRSISLK